MALGIQGLEISGFRTVMTVGALDSRAKGCGSWGWS